MGSILATDSSTFSAPEESNNSSRSLFSRLGLPLRARATRNVADFHIRTDEPYRKYAAGERACGAVVLTVLKRVRITHLTVALHGYVKVFKKPGNGSGDAMVNPADVPSGSSPRFQYKGNGFASLFSDEQVLSGDGPLEPGKYEFNFELEFPGTTLPSSIDFERGTISYMITATLTRPTTISPITVCERKVYVVEKVDVGLLATPRPRIISLEPISKRQKRRRPTITGRNSTTSDAPELASDVDSAGAREGFLNGSVSRVAEEHSHDAQPTPQSPVQSEIRSISGDSAISVISVNTGRSRNGDTLIGWSPSASQSGSSKTMGLEDRTITATVELMKGGCLPGDTVAVKVLVQHVRRIKSMHGVIVTLYRQGKIDSAPPLSVFGDKLGLSEKELKRLERDEYYPKSRTGLGGLSLSSAGSCSVFRKDLSQTFSPLILDPVTLSASVKASVRVPEDVFPTIKGIPGDMISFKYQVEVLVDLGGKLASQLQVSSSPSPGNSAMVLGSNGVSLVEGSGQVSFSGTAILDTDRLRREKGVVSVIHEMVVGTSDSSRQRDRLGVQLTPSAASLHGQAGEQDHRNDDTTFEWQDQDGETGDTDGHDGYHDYEPALPPPTAQYPLWRHPQPPQASAPFYVPPPEVPDESRLTDKEQMKRAEQQLLPSRPPGAPGRTITFADDENDDENIYDADGPPPRHRDSTTQGEPGADREVDDHEEGPSAPTLDDVAEPYAGPSGAQHPDKLERERDRLLQEASAPLDFPDDNERAEGPASPASAPPADLEPSAPVLADDDDDYYGPSYAHGPLVSRPTRGAHGTHGAHDQREQLPSYER